MSKPHHVNTFLKAPLPHVRFILFQEQYNLFGQCIFQTSQPEKKSSRIHAPWNSSVNVICFNPFFSIIMKVEKYYLCLSECKWYSCLADICDNACFSDRQFSFLFLPLTSFYNTKWQTIFISFLKQAAMFGEEKIRTWAKQTQTGEGGNGVSRHR